MMQKVHFRLTSVAQKRCCLSSLLCRWFDIFFFADLRDLGTKLEKELLHNEAGVMT